MFGIVRQLRSPNYVFLRRASSSPSLSKSDYSGIARESIGPIYKNNKNLENDVHILTQSLVPFHTLRAVGEQLQPRAKVKWEAYVREAEFAIKDAERKLIDLLSVKKKNTDFSISTWYDALMACISLDQPTSPPSTVEDLRDNSHYLGYKWSLRSLYKKTKKVHLTVQQDIVFEFFPETRDFNYKYPNDKLARNISEMAELRAAMYQRRIQDEILQSTRVEEEYKKRSKVTGDLSDELTETIKRVMEKLPSSSKTSGQVDNIDEGTGMQLVIENSARNKMAQLIFGFAIKNAKNQFLHLKEYTMSPLIAYLEQLKTLYRRGTHSSRFSLVHVLLQYPPLQTLLYTSLEETRKLLETTADKNSDSVTFFPPAVAAVMTEIDAIVTAGGKTLDYTEWRKALTNTDLYKPLVEENIPVQVETTPVQGNLDFLLGPADEEFNSKVTQDKNPNFFSQNPSSSLQYYKHNLSKYQNQSVLMERYAIINFSRQQLLLLQVNKDLFSGVILNSDGVPDGTDPKSIVEVRRYCIYKTINIPSDLLLKMKGVKWPHDTAKRYHKLMVELDLVKWRAEHETLGEQKV